MSEHNDYVPVPLAEADRIIQAYEAAQVKGAQQIMLPPTPVSPLAEKPTEPEYIEESVTQPVKTNRKKNIIVLGTLASAGLLICSHYVDVAPKPEPIAAAVVPATASASPTETASGVIPAPAIVPTTAASAEEIAIDQTTFVAQPIGCVATSAVTTNTKIPVSWYGALQSSNRPYNTNPSDYNTVVTGNSTVYGCLNDMRSVAYDQAATDASGIATYTYDTTAANLNLDSSQTQSMITTYDEQTIYQSFKKGLKDAKPVDARRLLGIIKRNQAAVAALNTSTVERKLTVPNRMKTLSSQAVAGMNQALQNQAAAAGYTLRFDASGVMNRTSLLALDTATTPKQTDDYKYFEGRAKANFTITPIVVPGTAP